MTIQSTIELIYSIAQVDVLPLLPLRLRSMTMALCVMGFAGVLTVWCAWRLVFTVWHWFQHSLQQWLNSRLLQKYPNATVVPRQKTIKQRTTQTRATLRTITPLVTRFGRILLSSLITLLQFLWTLFRFLIYWIAVGFSYAVLFVPNQLEKIWNARVKQNETVKEVTNESTDTQQELPVEASLDAAASSTQGAPKTSPLVDSNAKELSTLNSSSSSHVRPTGTPLPSLQINPLQEEHDKENMQQDENVPRSRPSVSFSETSDGQVQSTHYYYSYEEDSPPSTRRRMPAAKTFSLPVPTQLAMPPVTPNRPPQPDPPSSRKRRAEGEQPPKEEEESALARAVKRRRCAGERCFWTSQCPSKTLVPLVPSQARVEREKRLWQDVQEPRSRKRTKTTTPAPALSTTTSSGDGSAPFVFGAKPGENQASSSSSNAQENKPPFQFGSQAQGAAPSDKEKPPPAFGQNVTNSSDAKVPFVFGAPATTSANADNKTPASAPFQFGKPDTAAAPNATVPPSTDKNTATPTKSNSTNSTASTPQTSNTAQGADAKSSAPPPAAPAFSFGSTSTTAPAPPPASNTASDKPAFPFGSTSTTTPVGAPTPSAAPAPAFGAPVADKNPPSGFTNPTAAGSVNPPPFGAAAQPAFGQAPGPWSQPSFGGPAANPPVGGGFGSSASAFGAPSANPPAGGDLNYSTSDSNPFGGTPSFGSSQPASFNAANPTPGAPAPFGASSTAPPAGGFGAAPAPSQPFGAATANPFGATTAPPPFGPSTSSGSFAPAATSGFGQAAPSFATGGGGGFNLGTNAHQQKRHHRRTSRRR